MEKRILRILIVDDEPGLLFTLRAYLEDEGFQVETTTSSIEALNLLSTDTYDGVIVDINLPELDGQELILQALENNCRSKFFIHTGSREYTPPKDLISRGFSEKNVFHKPLQDLDILCQALNKSLKNSSSPIK